MQRIHTEWMLRKEHQGLLHFRSFYREKIMVEYLWDTMHTATENWRINVQYNEVHADKVVRFMVYVDFV